MQPTVQQCERQLHEAHRLRDYDGEGFLYSPGGSMVVGG